MHIVISCGGMPFDGNTIKERSLGGSESAAYYLALELVKCGHNVVVFTNLREPNTRVIDGVKYNWSGEVTKETPLGAYFTYYATNTPHDVLVIQRHPQAFATRYASNINLLWFHDLALYRYSPMIQAQLWNVDGVLAVSEFHKKQIEAVYEIDPRVVFAIQNGVDLSLFKGGLDQDLLCKYRRALKKRCLLYSSRPERGLINLVKPEGIMERLGDEYHLFVCSYENQVTQMAGLYAYLEGRIAALPNVSNLGALNKTQLATMMRKVQLLVYPTDFEEVSCITALEAMSAGLPMLSSHHAALPETCADSGTVLLPLSSKNEVDIDLFVDNVRNILDKENKNKYNELRKKQLKRAASFSWDIARQKLDDVVSTCFSRITDDAKVLNALYINDVQRLKLPDIGKGAVFDNAKTCLEQCYSFRDSDESMYQHYNKKDESFKAEVPRGSPRYDIALERVLDFIFAKRHIPETIKILDYAGNIGHYAVGFVQDIERQIFDKAEQKVRVEVYISELSKAARTFGKEWHKKEKLDNIKYLEDEAVTTPHSMDVILLGEILEHVTDPSALAQRTLKTWAKPGAYVLITVPFGPWEAQEYKLKDPHREHLWHFNREDLFLMFGKQPDYRLSCLPYGKSNKGEALGNYLVSCLYDPKSDLGRPAEIGAPYLPRESVSLCMIVRDAEAVLKRCLDSVIDLVDEVIIGIDKETTDRTREVLLGYEPNQCTMFHMLPIDSPVKTGFDEARNSVIKGATCDWVLWLDADEVLYGLANLDKYLRPNQFNGYLIKQQHFSVEPAGILRTDFPAKLFRRSEKIKFFGVVHEHPGINVNDGVGKCAILPDVVIKHDGYDTEAIRRQRFTRNVQLIIRDREKYPERILGAYLWMRDLSHMIKFELERNNNRITEEIIMRAKRGVELWEGLLIKADTRMLADALEYYTNFVNVLGGGFELAVGVSANKGNGTAETIKDKTKIARFLNTQHAEKYIDKLFHHEVQHYDSRYY